MKQLTFYQERANELKQYPLPKRNRTFLKGTVIGETNYFVEIVYDSTAKRHMSYIKGTDFLISYHYHGANKISDLCVGIDENRMSVPTNIVEDALKVIALLGG